MKITIIGAGGRMGSWFARYFYMRGHSIYLNDKDAHALQALASSLLNHGVGEESKRVTLLHRSILNADNGGGGVESIIDAINNSNIVMLSLPMDVIPKAVDEVARYMHRGSVLVEIASLKHDVHKALRDVVERYGIKPLSLHPLFGPGADVNATNRFVLIPVIDGRDEEGIAREILPNAKLVIVEDADEHDRIMAIVLGMVYAMNIAFADMLECKDIPLCKELAGSTFTLQSLIFEGILND
ncbi:MAG: prephenate dehydrogenase/arogenate dehydrogenase family protein, partial [Candidatus Nitrosocaldus sp.]